MNNVLGIINLHHNYVFGELSRKRTLATMSLLGRYYFIDFPLSNFTNSGINTIEILVKEKPSSLFKHLNLGAKEWAVNTKTGGINLMYNQIIDDRDSKNSDLSNMIENKLFIENKDVDYVVIAPCHVIGNIDYRKIVESHKQSGNEISIVYTKTKEKEKYKGLDKIIQREGVIESIKIDDNENCVILEIFVINKDKLLELLNYAKHLDKETSLKELIYYFAKKEKMNLYNLEEFVRCFRSLNNYIEYSIELLDKDKLALLFNKKGTIYTRTYDEMPTRYGAYADVSNCLIANGCIINGTITNSIIGRGVEIEKGAIVSNSIIYSRAKIKSGSYVEGSIVEKDVIIDENDQRKGNINKPIYIS